jgi:hypothetical protein
VIGLSIFAAFFHLEVLDPTNIRWLLHLDWGHSYLGWEAFRRDVWRWPLGYEKVLDWPTGDSVVFTDSLPGLAIVLKLFDRILPRPFQYIGLWFLLCVILQVYFGYRLMRRYGAGDGAAMMGGALVGLTPFFLARSYHNNLFCHWVLLWALELFWFSRGDRRRAAGFAAILTAAVLIHFYIAAMVAAIWAADLVREAWRRCFGRDRGGWAGFALRAVLTPCPALFAMLGCGYFTGQSPSEGGFGLYSTELLAWINPQTEGASRFLPPITVQAGGYEGLQYLGLGLIFAVLFGVARSLLHRAEPRRLDGGLILTFVLALLGLYALSDQVHLGQKLLVDLRYRIPIEPVANVLRANGRFMWPASYALIFAGLFSLVRLPRGPQLGVLGLALLIQVADLSGFSRQQRDLTAMAAIAWGRTPPADPRWDAVMGPARVVDYQAFDAAANLSVFYDNAYRAVMAGKPVTQMLNARTAPDQLAFLKADKTDFRAGRLHPDWLYVSLGGCGPSPGITAHELDGLTLVPPTGAPVEGLAIHRALLQSIELGQPLAFTNGDNACLLGSGWSQPEPWGVWTDGAAADAFLPLPQGANEGLRVTLGARVYPGTGQGITVLAQGREIGHLLGPFPEDQTAFVLPGDLIAGRRSIDLTFRIRSPVSPKARRDGDDTRTLGLGLKSVRFDSP